jgi:hypothetical protein
MANMPAHAIVNQQISNILNEIKRYKHHLRQLNKLLDDTMSIYHELKGLQFAFNSPGMESPCSPSICYRALNPWFC